MIESDVDFNQFYNWIGLEITSWTKAVAKFRCVLYSNGVSIGL